jgi:hypothetical protein
VSTHFFVQDHVWRMQAYPWFDMNLGGFGLLFVATTVLHEWFFFYEYYLIVHDNGLGGMVQPPLQLQLRERWSNQSVLPQGLCSTGPHNNCWVPMLDNILARFVGIVALVIFVCRVRLLGSPCTSVYLSEQSFIVIDIQTWFLLPGMDHHNLVYGGHPS